MSCSHARAIRTSSLEGELTIYTVADTKEKLFSQLGDKGAVMELDLQDVSDIDTAGVQLLMMAGHTVMNAGGALRLTNVQQPVQEVLDLFRLNSFFDAAAAHCPDCNSKPAQDAKA